MSKANRFHKNDKAFTGLEAAIVLIAFVVVAAVFSYVMLGAGFFTSQKSKEVVHTGTDMATSSVELSGDVIGVGNSGNTAVQKVVFTLSLTAGNNPVDISKLVISYRDNSTYVGNIFVNDSTNTTWIGPNNGNNLLEQYEKVQLTVTVPSTVGANGKMDFEIKPATGASLPITKTAPPFIENYMVLY